MELDGLMCLLLIVCMCCEDVWLKNNKFMDVVKVKDNSIVYFYKGGLNASLGNELIAVKCDKPFIGLILVNEIILICIDHIRASVTSLLYKNNVYEFIFYLKNTLEYKVSERIEKMVRSTFLLHTV